MRIIVLTGRRAAGKGIFMEVAKERGIPVYEMSSVIFEWMEKEGIKVSNESTAAFSQRIRGQYGNDIVARKLIEKIEEAPLIVISGARSKEEIGVFKKLGDVVVVEIEASTRVRYERTKERGREQDPKNYEEFVKRDEADNKLGQNDVLALADVKLKNEGSIEEFKEKVRDFLSTFS
ncbi:MAG: dephospho-CoA kinase [Methanobacteriota archaeon]|nr:MAG: dephospho-CoA kinase [Euryarchaeota archaeon]